VWFPAYCKPGLLQTILFYKRKSDILNKISLQTIRDTIKLKVFMQTAKSSLEKPRGEESRADIAGRGG